MVVVPPIRRAGSQSQSSPLQRQIDNAKTRLNAVGYGDHDSRGPLERAFNLPEGQNALFDIFEVLQRPLQGITNAASAVLNPRDTRTPWNAAVQGVTGKERVGGSDLLKGLGVDNNISAGVGGFALDVALDPLTYIPGGAIARHASNLGRGVSNVVRQATPNPILEQVDKIAKGAREGVENMFDVEAPLRRTLDGGQDDSLVQLRRRNINDERYHTQRIQDNVLGAVRAADRDLDKGVQVGREMERELGIYDPQGNPIPGGFETVASRGPANADIGIDRAAQSLMRANSEIRQLASESGITVNDIQGYMTHVLAKEYREAMGKAGLDSGRRGTGGNHRVLQRELEGTAEEINKKFKEATGMDIEMFEPNAFFATAHGQRRVLQYVLAERAKREILNNPAFARRIEPGERIGRLGPNETIIHVDDYRLFKSDADEMAGEAVTGGTYIVTKGAKQLLDAHKEKLSDEGVKQIMGIIGKASEWWKKFALFSPGYHARNDVGSKFNIMIAGMPIHEIPKYTMQIAYKDRTTARRAIEKRAENRWAKLTEAEEEALQKYDEFMRQGLSSSGLSSDFRFDPSATIENRVRREGMSAGRRALDRARTPFQTSQEFGNFVDELNRYGYFRWLLDSGNAKTADEAAEKVREVLFDYGDITQLERGIKTVIPFYTWMRKNIPFQLKNLASQPGKYSNFDKAVEMMYDITDLNAEEDIPDWLQEAMAVPIPGTGENPMMANVRPPVSDLAEALERPMGTVVGALSPLVSLPIELATNFNMFTGRPIEEFEGQTSNFFGADLPAKTTHALQNALGQIGQVSTNLERLQDGGNLLQALTSGLLRETNPEQQHEYNRMNELRALQDLMRLVEQQTGSRPPTLQDLQR